MFQFRLALAVKEKDEHAPIISYPPSPLMKDLVQTVFPRYDNKKPLTRFYEHMFMLDSHDLSTCWGSRSEGAMTKRVPFQLLIQNTGKTLSLDTQTAVFTEWFSVFLLQDVTLAMLATLSAARSIEPRNRSRDERSSGPGEAV